MCSARDYAQATPDFCTWHAKTKSAHGRYVQWAAAACDTDMSLQVYVDMRKFCLSYVSSAESFFSLYLDLQFWLHPTAEQN